MSTPGTETSETSTADSPEKSPRPPAKKAKPSNKVSKQPMSAKINKESKLTTKKSNDPTKDRKSNSSGAEDRLLRLVTACMRCRQKKVKCDRKVPKCSSCEKSGIDCVLLDPVTGDQVSRVTVQSLEMQVKELTKELESLRKEREDLEQPLLAQSNNEFKFGKVLLMKDSEIEDFYGSAAAVEIPARSFVESCLQSYFNLSNVQVPILHREYYLFNYFKPLYGVVGIELWQKLFGDNFDSARCTEKHFLDEKLNKLHKGKSLFFLYIIIAILTSQHQQKYPLMISNHYKKQAFKYIDHVWNAVDGSDDELSKLEMLQSLLLLTQYSLMRPCTPGAWYLLGTCVRLCQDLGLHNETVYLHSDDFYIVDMKRRLFWCCYSLDRQISIYFGRQFGIDSRQIDCPLLSMRDDLIIGYGHSSNYNVRDWLIREPQSKHVSAHYINLRILQGEIFDFINDTANRVPKPKFRGLEDPNYEAKVRSHDSWKAQKYSDLLHWFREVPLSDPKQFEFNQMIFKLNLNQSLIQLYGVSAITPIITDERHLKILYDAGREIIWTYVKLVEQKMINFSWVAINNLYMGATAYLTLISQSATIRSVLDLQELKSDCAGVVLVFDELCKICYEPAKDYTKKFKSHSVIVIEQCARERGQGDLFHTNAMLKSTSESNVLSCVGGSRITPATLVAPIPQRSTSMFASLEGDHETNKAYGNGIEDTMDANAINDRFLIDNDFFLNTMMGSINALGHEDYLESENTDGIYVLDPEYLVGRNSISAIQEEMVFPDKKQQNGEISKLE